jgi:hydroxymethylbilane synthase
VSEQPPRAAVRLGTRTSALAIAQTERVIELLGIAWPGISCELVAIVTQGDRSQASGKPLPEIGGKGVFTIELEQALRKREIDIAVHSLKDLPTEESPGLALGASCLRDDARDCLVARDGLTLEELPPAATVGTSSLRRAAQLRGMRHDLEVLSIRGNVDTRIRKVRDGELDAVVVAAAGIWRLERSEDVTEWFEPERMVPAPGQGALALQCREADADTRALLARVDDPGAHAEGFAERAFLSKLDAGCTAPVGAWAHATAPQEVRMIGLVTSIDGSDVVRVEGVGDPYEIGERLAREALSLGANRILETIRG